MAKIILFPVTPEIEARKFNRQIDEEIEEIHAKVDRDILSKYGSLEEYGRAIMLQRGFDI